LGEGFGFVKVGVVIDLVCALLFVRYLLLVGVAMWFVKICGLRSLLVCLECIVLWFFVMCRELVCCCLFGWRDVGLWWSCCCGFFVVGVGVGLVSFCFVCLRCGML